VRGAILTLRKSFAPLVSKVLHGDALLWRASAMNRLTLKRCLAAVGCLIFAAALAEAILRFVCGLGNPLLVQKDPDVGCLFQPNQKIARFGKHIRINSAHQRSDDFTPKAGVLRILVLGDSVTFGTDLDQSETITVQLQQQLCAHKPAEVLNASAASWGIGNELAYLRKFGTCDARWVILQIGSHDLLQQKSDAGPSMPERRPPLALGELWGCYLRPWFSGISASARAGAVPAQLQFCENMDDLIAALDLIRDAGAQGLILHTPERAEVTGTATACGLWREAFLAIAGYERVRVINLLELWRDDPEAASYFRDHVNLTAAGNAAVARLLTNFLFTADRWHLTRATEQLVAK
jgi:lysophospholipase L1-like esterase